MIIELSVAPAKTVIVSLLRFYHSAHFDIGMATYMYKSVESSFVVRPRFALTTNPQNGWDRYVPD